VRGRRGPREGERFNRASTDWGRDLEGRECVNEQLSSAESSFRHTTISMMLAVLRVVMDIDDNVRVEVNNDPVTASLRKYMMAMSV